MRSVTVSLVVSSLLATNVARAREVLVHIESPVPVQLEGRPDGEHDWHAVCAAPCDTRVPLRNEYRITGDKIRASDVFGIAGAAGARVVLTVAPTTNTASDAGTVLEVVGGLAMGAAVVVALFVPYPIICIDAHSDCGRDGAGVIASEGLLIGGVISLVLGVVVSSVNKYSAIAQRVDPAEARPTIAPPTPIAPLTTRRPTWRQPELLAPRPADVLPILSIAF